MAQYKINIAKQNGTNFYDNKHNPNYVHYCRIEIDVFPESKALEMLEDARKRYPVEEGFKVDMMRWETIGYSVG